MSSVKRALSLIKPHHRDDSHHSQSPIRSLTNFFHDDRSDMSSSEDNLSDYPLSKKQQKRERRRQERRERRSEEIRSEALSEAGSESIARSSSDIIASSADTPEMKAHYGDLPLMMSETREKLDLVDFDSINGDYVGKEIIFRARVHVIRKMSAKLLFVVFRQQLATFQGVLHEEPDKVSTTMIQWVERLRVGSIVKVKGVVREPETPIIGTTVRNWEAHLSDLHVVVRREESVPFSVYEAELTTTAEDIYEGRRSRIPDRTRLSNRILDLRTDVSQSIFRIQSGVSNLFRSALDEQRFIEIHTPKLQGAATESGASVFSVNYFGRPAFLAQSPQLAKQMAIASDFERVYEIGAVFRAEDSNTHRHLTEYTGLDIEMAIESHYHEMMEVLDKTLKTIFKGVYDRYRREVNVVKHHFPHDDLVWLEETLVLSFTDAIKILNESGWLDEDGNPLSDLEDLHTRDEIRLGQVIKEKFNTDYYIIDKFPVGARPFYAMPDPKDPRFTNSFDIFVRGQEIVSGGQRVHDADLLEGQMRTAGIDPAQMDDYLEGFKWGAPPHGGAGIGLERLLMLLLKIPNIRLASLFYRDPKSFPKKPITFELRHPESSTVNPPWHKDRAQTGDNSTEITMQPLEDLIANYGDATSTSWPDPQYKIWRDKRTGAAVSYVPQGKYAIIPGNPLCDPSQYKQIISAFLGWLRRETHLKPIWILCFPEVEDILGEHFGWRSLSCVAEERVNPSKNKTASDGEIARKIRHAQNEGVKITALRDGEAVPADVKLKVDARVQDWLANRKGTQVHLSEIRPWRDERHRRYFWASDRDGEVCAFVVLHQLAPVHGMQVKYSLDFPNSPSGAIEYLITHAIQAAAASGVRSLTFGAGATSHLTPGHHMKGSKIVMLQRTYDILVKQFNLTRKTAFRAKLGAEEGPLYIAYPPGGLGSRGIKAILNFFED